MDSNKNADNIYNNPKLPKLIRTSKYEIPIKFDINTNELEFTFLGLYISKENGDNFTREEWINILKENTPKNSKYIWDLLKLEDCVLENGRFDKSLIDINIENNKKIIGNS
jgi:hypothetical protein